jgi:membrane protein
MLRKLTGSHLLRLAVALGASSATNYASALAFAAFLSVFPILLGLLAILGLLFRSSPSLEASLLALLVSAFPASAQGVLAEALGGVKTSAGLFGLLALAGLLWSASSVFSTLEFALSQILGVKQRSLPRQKLMGLALMAGLLAFILLTLAANFWLTYLPASFPLLTFTLSLLANYLALLALTLCFYRLVPNRTYALKGSLPGALFAAGLILLASLAFPLYVHFAIHANVFGASFGLFFVLAAWLYLLSLFLLFGAALNRYHLGAPTQAGIFASPPDEARGVPTPLAAIHEQQSQPPG